MVSYDIEFSKHGGFIFTEKMEASFFEKEIMSYDTGNCFSIVAAKSPFHLLQTSSNHSMQVANVLRCVIQECLFVKRSFLRHEPFMKRIDPLYARKIPNNGSLLVDSYGQINQIAQQSYFAISRSKGFSIIIYRHDFQKINPSSF